VKRNKTPYDRHRRVKELRSGRQRGGMGMAVPRDPGAGQGCDRCSGNGESCEWKGQAAVPKYRHCQTKRHQDDIKPRVW